MAEFQLLKIFDAFHAVCEEASATLSEQRRGEQHRKKRNQKSRKRTRDKFIENLGGT